MNFNSMILSDGVHYCDTCLSPRQFFCLTFVIQSAPFKEKQNSFKLLQPWSPEWEGRLTSWHWPVMLACLLICYSAVQGRCTYPRRQHFPPCRTTPLPLELVSQRKSRIDFWKLSLLSEQGCVVHLPSGSCESKQRHVIAKNKASTLIYSLKDFLKATLWHNRHTASLDIKLESKIANT